MRRFTLRVTLAALALALGAAWAPTAQAAMSADEIARMLAGNPQSPGTLASYWRTSAYLSVAQQSRIRAFASAQMRNSYERSTNVLYFFGGPDVIYPQMFFPQMRELMLVGLEEVGGMPTANYPQELAGLAAQVGHAHQDVAQLSFHRTIPMDGQLASLGVTPLLVAGLAVTGNRVLDVTVDKIDRGSVRWANDAIVIVGGNNRVRIRYQRPDGVQGRVTYVNMDLSDNGFHPASSPTFLRMLAETRFDTAFYKAASFASHNPFFSSLNSFVSSNVSYLIQSDNGLPASYFLNQPRWRSITLYGAFSEPLRSAFPNVPAQENLLQAYASVSCLQATNAYRALWPGRNVCAEYGLSRPPPGVTWGGSVPFGFDYNTQRRNPGAGDVMPRLLIYAEAR